MQTKKRVVIAHKEYGGSFINRLSNGLTTDLDNAMTFKDIGDASEFLLNNMYAPLEKESYCYKFMEVNKRILEDEEDERKKELVSEDQPSDAGR